MIQLFNYTELIEEGGRKRLFDPVLYEIRMNQVEKLIKCYDEIYDLFVDLELPVGWTMDVAENGVDALRRLVRERVRRKAEDMELPKRVVDNWCRMAVEEVVDSDMVVTIRNLCADIGTALDGLPLNEGDITVTGDGVTINKQSLADRIREGCSREVTREDEENAEKLLQLAKAVEELEYKGVNAREVINTYVLAKKEPTEFERLRDIVTRRHRVGYINADYSTFNPAAAYAGQ